MALQVELRLALDRWWVGWKGKPGLRSSCLCYTCHEAVILEVKIFGWSKGSNFISLDHINTLNNIMNETNISKAWNEKTMSYF